MFFGEFQYKIDEKGRVPIPPRFRRDLASGMVLAPGVEKCITIYSIPEWKNLAENLQSNTLSGSKIRRLKRTLFATAFNLKMDSQGRVALPYALRQHAEITDSAVVAGANNYLEIWNPDRWQEEKQLSRESAWQTIESLERR